MSNERASKLQRIILQIINEHKAELEYYDEKPKQHKKKFNGINARLMTAAIEEKTGKHGNTIQAAVCRSIRNLYKKGLIEVYGIYYQGMWGRDDRSEVKIITAKEAFSKYIEKNKMDANWCLENAKKCLKENRLDLWFFNGRNGRNCSVYVLTEKGKNTLKVNVSEISKVNDKEMLNVNASTNTLINNKPIPMEAFLK